MAPSGPIATVLVLSVAVNFVLTHQIPNDATSMKLEVGAPIEPHLPGDNRQLMRRQESEPNELEPHTDVQIGSNGHLKVERLHSPAAAINQASEVDRSANERENLANWAEAVGQRVKEDIKADGLEEALHAGQAKLTRADELSANNGDDIVVDADGIETVNPALTESERIRLEENTAECMLDTPTYECYEKYGSYGIRTLHVEDWDDIVDQGYQRPEWMKHPVVQNKRLFDITFPGTHNSGTYDFDGAHEIVGKGLAFGAQCQHLGVDKQLELGYRALDLRVAFSTKKNELFLSHAVLTVPLAPVLGDIRAFLDARPNEVVILIVKPEQGALKDEYVTKVLADADDPTKIPGQTVHDQMVFHFGDMLATWPQLQKLPEGEIKENPLIKNLVAINARVIYFWDTQQVLCTDRAQCQTTPGWNEPWGGFAFGWPMHYGSRVDETPGSSIVPAEPNCIFQSWLATKSAHPDQVVKRLKKWMLELREYAGNPDYRPKCYPQPEASPEIPLAKQPTILYWADAYVTMNEVEGEKQRILLGQSKSVFTRGEGFSVETSAERVNYLSLVWMLKLDSRALYMAPNVVGFDFSPPILAHRIIEANQEQKDCGWAIICKKSGSCWAKSLLKYPDQEANPECLSEEDAMLSLKAYSKGKEMSVGMRVFLGLTGCLVPIICCCVMIRLCKRRQDNKKKAQLAAVKGKGLGKGGMGKGKPMGPSAGQYAPQQHYPQQQQQHPQQGHPPQQQGYLQQGQSQQFPPQQQAYEQPQYQQQGYTGQQAHG